MDNGEGFKVKAEKYNHITRYGSLVKSEEGKLILVGSAKKYGVPQTFETWLGDVIPEEYLGKKVSVTIRILKQDE